MANDHPITVKPIKAEVTVAWRGKAIARTRGAVELFEANYPGVVYVPRADVDSGLLDRSLRTTTCPFKGEANYYSLKDGAGGEANAIWTYEAPKAVAEGIRGFLAFYPDKVTVTRSA